MNTVEISIGKVTLKNGINRGLRKAINKALNVRYTGKLKEATKKGEEPTREMEMKEVSKADEDNAEDIAVLGMIEKFTDKEGKEKTVDQKFIDDLDEDDFDLIKEEINKITTKKDPKE